MYGVQEVQPIKETALPVPVSYTHLDVYKRQGLSWLIFYPYNAILMCDYEIILIIFSRRILCREHIW